MVFSNRRAAVIVAALMCMLVYLQPAEAAVFSQGRYPLDLGK